jgi:hypothetical protein
MTCWRSSTATGRTSPSDADAAPLAVKLVAAGWRLDVPPQSHPSYGVFKVMCSSGHRLSCVASCCPRLRLSRYCLFEIIKSFLASSLL